MHVLSLKKVLKLFVLFYQLIYQFLFVQKKRKALGFFGCQPTPTE